MKKFIIVCDEKHQYVADYLSQLISTDDDVDGQVVGTKDGEVVVQVWNEKEYKNNSAQISSNQYILFVGDSKLVKEKSFNMNVEFRKYGMKYGWLGRQGFLTVENPIPSKEEDEFKEFASTYRKNIELALKKDSSKKKIVIGAAAWAVAGIPAVVAVGLYKRNKRNKEIEKQQYSCCVLKFYLDDINRFLNV